MTRLAAFIERERTLRNRLAIALGVAALWCGIAVSEPLIYDPFEERSRLLSSRVLATSYAITLADYQTMAEEAAKKFGPKSKTVMHSNTGQVVTTIDDKVVATSEVKARIDTVYGMFLVGRLRSDMARFPFALSAVGKRQANRDVGKAVRTFLEDQAQQLLDFHDLEWANLWCWTQEPPDMGATFASAPPRLGTADLCLVRWRRGEGKTMLIGELAADGGAWVRDASRPLCRMLAGHWLKAPERAVTDTTIDYVGCVLVYDPDRGTRGTSETVADVLYEVRPDRSLLLIN
jgi:hypothetical protein